MSRGDPLVSVLTPSYGQARWLADNLRSVACQTYPAIEHIVMDGGSADGSVEVLRERAGPHVRWRSEPDEGQSHALLKAFAASSGEIIGWLNSDDAYFDHKAVERAVRVFRERPEVDVVYGHAALVNPEGLILQILWVPPFSYRLLRVHNFIPQPAAFIRRSALAAGFVDRSYDYAMDRELWLRLGRAHRFARVNRVLAIDRHHPARKSYRRGGLEQESPRLAAAYGVPRGSAARAALKGLKIAFRLAGLEHVPRAAGPYAFAGRLDGVHALALRQVAVPRAAMPMGGAGARPAVEGGLT